MIYARVLAIAVLAIGLSHPLEAATATWDRNPEPTVVGYRLSYGTQPGIHGTSLDVGNVVSYVFFPPLGQRYYVVVQALDSTGALSSKSAEVVFDAPAAQNQPPVLIQPANQSATQNSSQLVTLVASDPEGATVSFGAAGLPPGLTLHTGTGVISGTVTTVGTYTVTATASDGSLTATRTFTWTVAAAGGGTNTLILSPEDTELRRNTTNYASDPRLHALNDSANSVGRVILMKFDLSQLPANAAIQTATLRLSLIEGDYHPTDSNYTVALHQILNRNPVLARATGVTADGVTAWTSALAQSDISPARSSPIVDRALGVKTWDALALVQAWRSAPSTNYGLLLNGDATKGEARYRVFASMENASPSQRPSLQIVYTVPGTPGDTTPPAVSMSAPANNATVSGPSVSVSATASDAVGVVGVQFRLDGANLGAEDTTSPYSIVWNSTTASIGSHVLTAVARDAAGNSATSTAITVSVSNNRTPTLTQPANQTSPEGSAASVALVASDPDGNPLTFSATGLPPGLAISTASGLISGTPTFTSAGTYSITTTVSDGSLSQSRTFSWTVTNTNRAPVLVQPANQTSAAGSTVSLQLSASDADGSALTYQATGLPAALTINPSTGLITGTLAANSGGVHIVTVAASDGALAGSRTFTWSVGDTDAPVRGDFDGDGRADPATYRASTGEWRLWPSASNFVVAAPISWGITTDIPVPADYDGDRRTDIAVYRPSTGVWHVLLSTTNMQSSLEIQWGNATDRPLPLDYDNDGRADLALPRFGGFEILLSSTNYASSITVR